MPTASATATSISFKAPITAIEKWTIIKLPKDASAQLPSRGQVMVEGTINGKPFATPLEPDGMWSHWFQPDAALLKAINAKPGDRVSLEIHATKNWPEPEVPADLLKALKSASPKVQDLWRDITPMARWEWVRWIRSTGKNETRQKRLQVACSKMQAGERRPCCWNRNLCTEPSISKNGVLFGSLPE